MSTKRTQRNEASLDSKLEDLKKRFHLLEGERKAYTETSQWSLQSHKETITTLRQDNKQLYLKLDHLQRVVKAHLEGNNEAEKMAYQLREVRKKHDEVKRKAEAKQQQLLALHDTLRGLMMETPGLSSQAQGADRIKGLEAKIEHASLKHNEALAVKRTYDQILDHLLEDRIGYDTQVDTLEQGVQLQDKELTELTVLHADATRSKELARDELAKCEARASEDKRRRDQATEEKRQRIKQLMEGNARIERKMKREEMRLAEVRQRAKPTTPTPEKDPSYYLQHLKSLVDMYRSVSSLAGAGQHFSDIGPHETQSASEDMEVDGIDFFAMNSSPDFNSLSQYINTQSATARTLETHQNKATARLAALKSEHLALSQRVAAQRLRLLLPSGDRQQVDAYEGRLAQANAAYVRARSKYERAAKANIAILAGVTSLSNKLQSVENGQDMSTVTVTDQNLSDIIQLCKQKVNYILSSVGTNEAQDSPDRFTTEPQFSMRIKTATAPQISEPMPDEGLVPTRASVKAHSAGVVALQLKKTKRKKRAGSAGAGGALSSSMSSSPPPTSRNYSPSSTARFPNGREAPASARHK